MTKLTQLSDLKALSDKAHSEQIKAEALEMQAHAERFLKNKLKQGGDNLVITKSEAILALIQFGAYIKQYELDPLCYNLDDLTTKIIQKFNFTQP